ncbi:hypothetical protein K9N68_20335 [Kovacikia minuta CCNUW1]|uniref:hypothetical protein n=1 Tax=Kovacikia minuta TaxID=2931930 RepID=UPI001CCB1A7E|nr:hypothetical protein [Kovacikia minuta]UBF24066.1 hypothetical protein K9N68_20335 [Kovacikia minuta CCNUW1]
MMSLKYFRSLSVVIPCLIGTSLGAVPASANPVGITYSVPFPGADRMIGGSSVPYSAPVSGTRSPRSGYYYPAPSTYVNPQPYRHSGSQRYRRSNPGISNSVLVNPTVINSSIRNSTLINPTIVNSSYYPPASYYPAYYPNLNILTVQSYTRPSPEVVVDPQYGVRFKNPPGY